MTTVKLIDPVEHDGKVYAELTLREVEFGSVVQGDMKSRLRALKAMVRLIAVSASVPTAVVEKLSLEDVGAAYRAVDRLLKFTHTETEH